MIEEEHKKTFDQLKEIQKLIRRESSLKGLCKYKIKNIIFNSYSNNYTNN